MKWGKGVASKEVREYRSISHYILGEISKQYDIPVMAVMRVELYNFLKRNISRGIFTPVEILAALEENKELYALIYKKRWVELMAALKRVTRKDYRDMIIATVFYNNYFETNSFVRAVLKTKHYAFYKFTKEEVIKLFNTYPFLRKQDHLNHVVEIIKRVEYASLITKNGIKELYVEEPV